MMDGVYATHPKQGRGLHFVRVPAPTTEEVGVLVAKIARKSERWLSKQGYETNEDWDVEACGALPLFQEASIAGRTATGARRGIKSRHVAWAQLLWHSFGVMGSVCQHCGCLMRLRAVAIYPPATTKILRGLGVNLHGLGCTGPP